MPKTKAQLIDLLRQIVKNADTMMYDDEQLAVEVRRSLIEEAREASGMGKANPTPEEE